MNIGVFDSGKGGEFIAKGLRIALPQYDFMVVNDSKNVPYGNRTNDEITKLTIKAIQPLINAQCKIIVIACNTATASSIKYLRSTYPQINFVGTEPMIKPASLISKTRHVTLLATTSTLASNRYNQLIKKYGKGLIIDEPNTSSWANAIENNKSDDLSMTEISKSIESGSDTIILACTHYLDLADRLRSYYPKVQILEPTGALAKQVQSLANKLNF